MHLHAIDIVVIILYFGSLSAIGFYFSKRQSTREAYFLGDRSMHWILVGGSIMATLISTISYLSLPGEMVRYGISFFVGYLVLAAAVPVINGIVIPIFLALPITSAYEYLEKRFDQRVSKLASSVFILKTLVWMGVIIYTASFAIHTITTWNIVVTIVLMGAVTTLYSAVGGLRSVIWTDNLQLVILMGGAILIPTVIGFSLGSGPAAWWQDFAGAGRADIQVFSWNPYVRLTAVGNMISMFIWYLCVNSSDQMAIQRFLSTPSVQSARRSMWVFALCNVLLIVALMFCGLALFAFYNNSGAHQLVEQEADSLMPLFIAEELPAGVTGMLVAALLAAAMSSLSSGINSISSVVSTDFIGSQSSSGSNLGQGLHVEKFVATISGVVGILMAIGVERTMHQTTWNLIELGARVNHIFTGPLTVLFFAGFLIRRSGSLAAMMGFFSAILVSVFVGFSGDWFGLERSISFMWLVPASFVAGLIVSAVASFMLAKPSERQLAGLTLRDVRAKVR